MSTSSPSISDFCIVLSESKRILNSHTRHFLGLSVLFLLPLSFSLSFLPSLLSSTTPSSHISTLLSLHVPPRRPGIHLHLHQFKPTETLALSFLFLGLALFLSVSAIGSITHSVFLAFSSRPVKLAAALRSLASSFIRLSATVIAAEIVVGLIVGVFIGFYYLCLKGFEMIGVQLLYRSAYFVGFVSVLGVLLGLVLMYLQVNWGLMSVVVVLESKWGYKSLARSRYLIRGMRSVGFAFAMFYGVFVVLLLWINVISGESEFVGGEWRSWAFVVQIVVTSAILTLLLLHGIAANTVLYMYCKALHGELAEEMVKDFDEEYVSLPCDDEKAARDVSVAQA